MRQVPQYTVIGNGKLATHLCHYFSLCNIAVNQWHRRLPIPLADHLSASSHVLLLINDDAIEPFVQANPILASKTLIHCSGALNTPLAHSAHPLQTFGRKLYDKARYERIPFITDAAGPDLATLIPQLNNPSYALAATDKAYYHSLCTMGNNFTTLIWQHVFTQFERRLHLPPEILHPLVEQTTTQLLNDPGHALTGPLSRHDTNTLDTHIKALADDRFHAIYQAFIDTYNTQEHV